MAAKIITVAVLAICLIQGNEAQRSLFSGVRNLVNSAAENAANAALDMGSKVSSAASNAQNLAQTAASNAQNLAQTAASNAQNIAQNAADSSITAALNLGSQLSSASSSLNPSEILATVQNVQQDIAAKAESAKELLENAIASAEQTAEKALASTTKSWNKNVTSIVSKAKELGVDVRDCATDSVVTLGKSSVQSAIKCVTDKIDEARTLVKNIVNLVPQSAQIVKNSTAGVKECRESNSGLISTGTCSARKLAPLVLQSAKLGKDAVSYYTRATLLVTTIREQLIQCATKVAASKTAEAAGLSIKIVSCVANKISSSS